MIVDEPPYDLVAVFADADAKMLFEELIERAQQSRILRPIRWRSIRDPRRDAFRVDPLAIIAPFRRLEGCHFFFSWDHSGSGRENISAGESEEEVLALLRRSAITDDKTLVVAYTPEVEGILVPVWTRTKDVISGIREEIPPPDDLVLEYARRHARQNRIKLPDDAHQALQEYPKEMLVGLVAAVQLRWSASVFQQIGRQVSLTALRNNQHVDRIFLRLSTWFPP